MKPLFVFLLFLAPLGIAAGQDWNWQQDPNIINGWRKEQLACDICGATMYRNVKIVTRYSDNMPMSGWDGWGPRSLEEAIPDSLQPRQINFPAKASALICRECNAKYGTGLIEAMDALWNETLTDAKNSRENVESRKHWEKARRKEKLAEFDKRMEAIEKERENYLHPPPPPKPDTIHWRSFLVDTSSALYSIGTIRWISASADSQKVIVDTVLPKMQEQIRRLEEKLARQDSLRKQEGK